jgi:hypothetical protein
MQKSLFSDSGFINWSLFKKVGLFTTGIVIFALIVVSCLGPGTQNNQNEGKYTVAIYYWPNFHPDNQHQSKKGQDWTEWEIVKNGKPEFDGHYQPKVPIWGYPDESDPKVMARSIDVMADAGIGAIIFDWYRYDDSINGGIMIEEALKKGFLNAPNRNRVKFALMWANHTYIDCHPFAEGDNFSNAPVWRKGEVSRDAFDRHTQDAIQNYFTQPNYWKIDGSPYFSIYDLDKLISGLGGLEATSAALDNFRERTKMAGFPDLHLNIVDQGLGFPQVLEKVIGQTIPGVASRKVETMADLLLTLNTNSSTMYTWVHHLWPMLMKASEESGSETKTETQNKAFGFSEDPSAQARSAELKQKPSETSENTTLIERAARAGVVAVDYSDYGNRAMIVTNERPSALGVNYFPHVSMGWDGTPRNYSMGIVLNNTPEKWKDFLAQTKDWLDKHPESKGIVTLNSWNEWVEGSYIEPDSVYGTSYLDAVKEVFGSE